MTEHQHTSEGVSDEESKGFLDGEQERDREDAKIEEIQRDIDEALDKHQVPTRFRFHKDSDECLNEELERLVGEYRAEHQAEPDESVFLDMINAVADQQENAGVLLTMVEGYINTVNSEHAGCPTPDLEEGKLIFIANTMLENGLEVDDPWVRMLNEVMPGQSLDEGNYQEYRARALLLKQKNDEEKITSRLE